LPISDANRKVEIDTGRNQEKPMESQYNQFTEPSQYISHWLLCCQATYIINAATNNPRNIDANNFRSMLEDT
jgi:sugar (pentulose or hexulose) kinase